MRKTKNPRPQPSNTPSSTRTLFSPRTKLLLFTGLFLLLFSGFYYLNQTIQLTYFVPNTPTDLSKMATTSPLPVEISIPSVSLTLPVSETNISNNTWQIAEKGASHLAVSASPSEAGPVIMYAHNTDNKFGPIRWLKKGDEIIITTMDNKIHTYAVTDMVTTDPSALSVFFTRNEETLYLFTCVGFADLKRFVVIAEPKTGIAKR